MFVPIPPPPDDNELLTPDSEAISEPELELEPESVVEPDFHASENVRGRHRVAWRALLRLSFLFRVFAVLNLVVGAVLAIGALFLALQRADVIWLLYAFYGVVSGIIGYIVWTGLAEAILVFIAIEKNTRQTRDRLQRVPR